MDKIYTMFATDADILYIEHGTYRVLRYSMRYDSIFEYNDNRVTCKCDYSSITSTPFLHYYTRDGKEHIITSLDYCFKSCTNLEFVDLSNWDVSNVRTFKHMFEDCEKLKTVKLNWNTVNAIDFDSMFKNCCQLQTLDISSFNFTNTVSINYMFYNCISIESIKTGHCQFLSLQSMDSCFTGCKKLELLDIDKWNIPGTVDISFAFYDCCKLPRIEFKCINKVSGLLNAFKNCQSAEYIKCDWQTTKLDNLVNTFSGCSKLKYIDCSTWNTHDVIAIDSLFNNCYELTEVKLFTDTNKVKSMNGVFCNCYKLTHIPIQTWNMQKVTSSISMFRNCKALTELPLLLMSKCEHSDNMFNGCKQLVKIMADIPAITRNGMYANCDCLHTIIINVSKCTSFDSIFDNCSKLAYISIKGTNRKLMAYIASKCKTV